MFNNYRCVYLYGQTQMSETVIELNERKLYDLNINGQKFTLSYDELIILKRVIDKKIDMVSTRIPLSDNKKNVTSNQEDYPLVNTISNPSNKIFPIPNGYQKIFEEGCDPKSGYDTTFVYYKDDADNWGFQTISSTAGSSSFTKLGNIHDSTSMIGELASKIPEGSFIKRDLFKMGIQKVTEGRRLKACVDVLCNIGVLKKEISLSGKRNTITYQKALIDMRD
jgi:hypothetical protein